MVQQVFKALKWLENVQYGSATDVPYGLIFALVAAVVVPVAFIYFRFFIVYKGCLGEPDEIFRHGCMEQEYVGMSMVPSVLLALLLGCGAGLMVLLPVWWNRQMYLANYQAKKNSIRNAEMKKARLKYKDMSSKDMEELVQLNINTRAHNAAKHGAMTRVLLQQLGRGR